MNERTTDSEETLARISELARQALQAQANAAKQSFELGRAALSSQADPSTAGRAWVEAVSREGARYWKEVGALGIDVAGQLMTLGSRGMARVLADTQAAVQQGRTATRARAGTRTQTGQQSGQARAARADESGDERSGSRRSGAEEDEGSDEAPRVVTSVGDDVLHVPVTLHGSVGGTAIGTVVLANQHPRARRVVLTPSDLRARSGRKVALTLRVDPPGATIPAMGEHSVAVEVDLSAGTARSGERYTGTIEVSGGVEAAVDVTVEVA